jgi:hypothetical protein
MADLYNVAAGAYQTGRARAQEQRLNELARLALSKPSQQMAIASQMAAVSPQAGFALAQQVQDRQAAEQAAMVAEQEKRRVGAANFARYLANIRDPQRRQQVAQGYASKFGDQFPQDLSDEGLAAFSAYAGGQGGESFRPMVVAPGSALVGPDGRVMFQNQPREQPQPIVRVPDGMGGEVAGYNTPQGFVPLSGAAPSGPTPQLPYRVNLQGLQPESVAIARQQIEADIGRPLNDSEWAQVSGQGAAPQIGRAPAPRQTAFVDMTPQEIAAAGLPPGTVAQRNPLTNEIRPIRQADAATLKEQASIRTKAPRLNAVVRSLTDINNAMTDISKGLGTMGLADTGPVDQFITRFTPEGDRLNKAVQRLSSDILALTRVPGIGSQSDLEARLDQLRYPSLGSLPEANKESLLALGLFIRDLADAYEAAGDEATAAQIRNARPQLDAVLSQIDQPASQAAQGEQYQVGQIIEVGGKRYRVTGGDPNDPDVEEVR